MIVDYIEIKDDPDWISIDFARKLYLFLGVTEDIVDEELYYFINGESLEYNGWTLGATETGKAILKGDILFKLKNGTIKRVHKDLAFLVHDSLLSEKYGQLLEEIYDSGDLKRDMLRKYREVVIEGGLS